ncbi:MAG: NHL repeat-containing protein [Chthonomonadales bacterium]
MTKIKTSLILLSAMCLIGMISGCGGSRAVSSSSRMGTVRFSIKWPVATRLTKTRKNGTRVIPVSAQSIDISVQDTGGKVLAHRLFVRPTSVTTTGQLDITNVLAGTVKVVAKAYPETDGSGTLQSQGSVLVTVEPLKTVNASLSMASTVTHLKIFKDTDTINVGDRLTIAVNGLDSSENTVMTAPEDWDWGADAGANGTYASFVSSGLLATVTGVSPGNYVINTLFLGTDASQPDVTISTAFKIVGVGSNSHIIILDHGNKRIVGVNDMSGAGFTTLGSGVTFYAPLDMALDSTGNIFVAEYQSSDATGFHKGRIVKLDPNGVFVGEFIPTSPPSMLYVDKQGKIYWRDDNLFINRIDNISGANLQKFGGISSGLFGDPVGLAIDSGGYIYVLDGTGNRVVRVDNMSGANPVRYGTKGNGRDNFDLLDPLTYSGANHGLSIDKDNHVYVADYANNRIVRFDANALNDITTSNFNSFPINQPYGGNGANYFFPISVSAVDEGPPGAFARIYLTGEEKAARSGPFGTNDAINDWIVKADTIGSSNLTALHFGGPVGSGQGQFKGPLSIAVR